MKNPGAGVPDLGPPDLGLPDLGPPDLDRTLALLGAEQPRPGLEGRMLARLDHPALQPRALMALHLSAARLRTPVLCVSAAAVLATVGLQYYGNQRAPVFVPRHLPAQVAGHGFHGSEVVAVPQKPIHPATPGRAQLHPGRGRHAHVLLPPGTYAPTHRNLVAATAH